MQRTEVFKLTQENWHGSYQIDGWHNGVENPLMLRVSYLGNICSYDKKLAPIWRTCVWGNDDNGMEYDCSSEQEAWDTFVQVISQKYVNRAYLKSIGFVPA